MSIQNAFRENNYKFCENFSGQTQLEINKWQPFHNLFLISINEMRCQLFNPKTSFIIGRALESRNHSKIDSWLVTLPKGVFQPSNPKPYYLIIEKTVHLSPVYCQAQPHLKLQLGWVGLYSWFFPHPPIRESIKMA